MTAVQDKWLELAKVEAFAGVSLEVARAAGHPLAAHEAALTDARADLVTLEDAGVEAPVGLAEAVADAVAGLRATYVEHATSAEERLALPDGVRHVMGVNDASEQRRLDTANAWIAAIDSAGGV